MALSFPLSLADFWDRLPIASGPLGLTEAWRISITAGGHVRAEDDDTRLWSAEVAIDLLVGDEVRDARALLDAVRQAGSPFLAYDVGRPWPREDFAGAGLAGASPVIDGLPADPTEIRLSGLPANYVLRRGDLFAYQHSDPVRHALHEVLDDSVQAGGGGLTPIFQVQPARQPGPVGGEAITLIKPAAKFVVVPGSYQQGTQRQMLIRDIRFRIVQTMV